MAWDMWQHQNKVLHENQDNRPRILEMETNQQVTELFAPQHIYQQIFPPKTPTTRTITAPTHLQKTLG